MYIRIICLVCSLVLILINPGYSSDRNEAHQDKEPVLNREITQDKRNESFSNQTIVDDVDIDTKQANEFKTLLDKLSADFDLSFDEKVEKLNSLLLEQQEEMISSLTTEKAVDN